MLIATAVCCVVVPWYLDPIGGAAVLLPAVIGVGLVGAAFAWSWHRSTSPAAEAVPDR